MNTNCNIFRTTFQLDTISRIALLLLLSCNFSLLRAQAIIWTDTINGIYDQQGLASCFDSNGNLIVVGQYQGTVTLNTISGPVTISSDGAANDGLIVKYNTAGKVIWYNTIGGTFGYSDDECLGVTADDSDNIYICGYTRTTTTIFYGRGNPDIYRTNNGSEDAYLAKYNPNGDLVWVVTPIGIGTDRAWDVTTDGTDVYVVGQFTNSLDFNSGPLSLLLNIPGNAVDGFIVSYSTAGTFNWINRVQGITDQVIRGITHYGTQLYATGYYGNNNSTFNGTPSITMNNINVDDAWTASYNKNDGNIVWVAKAGGSGTDRGRDVIANANGVFTTGYFANTLNTYSPSQTILTSITSNGNIDGFLIHYDLNGIEQNLVSFGGTGNDYGNNICFDDLGDIYAVGTFEGTVNFGSGNIISSGLSDCFLAKYSSNCLFQSVLKMGSIGADNIRGICSFGNTGGFTGYYNGGAFSIPTIPTTPANPWVGGDELFVGYIACPPPEISCPANITQNNDPGNCSAAVAIGSPVVTLGCTPFVFINSYNTSNDASDTYPLGTTTVTWTGTDINGGTASCVMDVTIIDIESPVITCGGNINANADPNKCNAIINGIAPLSFSDNCIGTTVSYTISGATTGSGMNDASGEAFNSGISTVTYTATDASGNSGSCSFDVNIIDNQAPTISCPGNLTLSTDPNSCSRIVNDISPVSTSDNCSGSLITYSITGATTTTGTGDASGTAFNLGVSTVTYTITDGNGLFATCSFTISISDNQAPTISCPVSVIQNASPGLCSAIVNNIAPTSSSDNCSVSLITYSISGATIANGNNDASGLSFNSGVSTVTYAIADNAGNTASCSFTVTINDNESPTIICPGNMTVNTDPGNCGAVVNGIAPFGINDNCSVSGVDFTLSGATNENGTNDASGTFFNTGVTNVNYTVTDGSGNTTSCSFTVTVIDNEFPTVSCPSDIYTGNDIGFCSSVINGIAPVVSDNCSLLSIAYTLTGATVSYGINDASGSTFNVGTTTVTYTVTDASSNISTCSFTVTINDTESPSITCPPFTNVNSDPGFCTAIVNTIAPVIVSDNCTIASVTYTLSGSTTGSGNNDASGETFNAGITNVTYSISDASSNVSTCTFTVRVDDNEAPVIICPNDTLVNNDFSFCSAMVNDLAPLVFSDNCSVSGIDYNLSGVTTGAGINDASGLSYNLGTTTITYTIVDASLNSSTCSFDLTIIDSEKPQIVCTADIFSCDSLVSWTAPNATDNCGVNSITQISGLPSGSIFPVGTTTIAYVAEDNSGNADTCSFIITVYPVTDSTWLTPADVCDSSSPVNLNLLVTGEPGGIFSGPGVTNNTFDPSVGAGTYSITYTASLNGCVETMTNTITVLPSPVADAGIDVDTCGLEAELSASAVNGIGVWSGSGITFNPSANDEEVNIILPNYATHFIYWTVNQSGVCSVTDTVIVTNYEPLVAYAGTDQHLTYTEEAYLNANNAFPGTGSWTGGNDEFVDITDPQTLAQNLLVGENYLYWTIVNGTCPPSTDEVIITIDDITIPDVITPNFDGKNDYFVIHGIEFIGPVKMEIFNRWGQIIYSNSNYLNDWSGQNSDGNELPNDTYFYIITIKNNKTYQGYIVLKK